MKHNELEHFAAAATRWTGSTSAFIVAVGIIVVWLLSGPIFHFSDTWQLVINTGTTIITFLMVFLIQHAQNRDTQAIHVKLDELIRATKGAHNRLIALEDQSEEDLAEARQELRRVAEVSTATAEQTKRLADAKP